MGDFSKRLKMDRQLLITGIPLIDRQHEEYANLVDRLFEHALQGGVTRAILAADVGAVTKYAMEHFDAEELIMRDHRYPAYEEHRAKHNIFRDRSDTFVTDLYDEPEMDEFTVRLSRWLIEWFCDQVQTDDRKLAAFLTQSRTPAHATNQTPPA